MAEVQRSHARRVYQMRSADDQPLRRGATAAAASPKVFWLGSVSALAASANRSKTYTKHIRNFSSNRAWARYAEHNGTRSPPGNPGTRTESPVRDRLLNAWRAVRQASSGLPPTPSLRELFWRWRGNRSGTRCPDAGTLARPSIVQSRRRRTRSDRTDRTSGEPSEKRAGEHCRLGRLSGLHPVEPTHCN